MCGLGGKKITLSRYYLSTKFKKGLAHYGNISGAMV